MVGAAVGCSASISGCYVRPLELLWTCFDRVRQLHDCCVGNKLADRSPDCSPSYRHLSPGASGIPRSFAKPLHSSRSADVELYLHLPMWHSGGQLYFCCVAAKRGHTYRVTFEPLTRVLQLSNINEFSIKWVLRHRDFYWLLVWYM